MPASSSHIVHPRLPAWVINSGLTALITALWPLNWAMEEFMQEHYLRIIILIGISIILATSLNLINGITGQFSLGHAGFMAIGGYVAGSALRYFDPAGWDANLVFVGLVLLGGLFAAAAGLIIGIPTLRLRGDYLAIATLAFGEIIFILINATEEIGPFKIGGSSGLHFIPSRTNFFWVYTFVVICVVTVWRLAYSAKGLAFRAVREDEVAAAAMGIDTTYFKVAAFVIGSFFAGIAGALAGSLDGGLVPASFRFIRSIEIVVMVVLGGSGSVTGSILAAALLTYLPEQLRFFQDWRMITYSMLLILMMLLRPTGLLGQREIWWTRKRLATSPIEPKVVPPATPSQ